MELVHMADCADARVNIARLWPERYEEPTLGASGSSTDGVADGGSRNSRWSTRYIHPSEWLSLPVLWAKRSLIASWALCNCLKVGLLGRVVALSSFMASCQDTGEPDGATRCKRLTREVLFIPTHRVVGFLRLAALVVGVVYCATSG